MSVLKDKNEKRNALIVAHWFSEELYTNQTYPIKNASEKLLTHIYATGKPLRQHPKKHLAQIEIFLVNVLMAYWNNDGFMAISKASGEYTNSVVTYRVMVDLIIGSLKKSGWLVEHPGYFGGVVGFRTRIGLTELFVEWLELAGIPPIDAKVKKPFRPVVIKSKNKKLMKIPIDLQQEARVMADQVQVFNDHLEKTHLDIAISADELEQLNSQMRRKAVADQTRDSYLFLAKKYLQRKFNNGTLKDGGRFYNGWWINIPKEWRKYITINGYKTAELDYSGMHIKLLYAREQKVLSGDPYDIGVMDDKFRAITKLIFFTIFNASSRQKALNAIRRNSKIKEYRNGKYPKGARNFDQYLALIEKAHKPISKYFCSGYGIKLQALDSKIIESVMKRMLSEYQVVTLPIHDSLIVDARYAKNLHEIMLEEFKNFTGGECEVKQKPLANYDDDRLSKLSKGYLVRATTGGNSSLKGLR